MTCCVDKKIKKTIYPFIHLLSKPTVHQPVRQATHEKTTITTQVTLECFITLTFCDVFVWWCIVAVKYLLWIKKGRET